ncbi:hypothetical protein RND81_01G134200 [Saponaria officinalis]|uniref:Structure-specific endonuclease subunit SLX1 homolog n=1 Tax=Saponaria officinalis TaxID=3572 RepID=A0AAW1N7A1_SAPOF
MRKSRKTKQKSPNIFTKKKKIMKKTMNTVADDAAARGVDGGGGAKFFGCYLLASLSPRHKGHTYIGFTVNPKRRIRQHNGEITSGASKTKRKRPWEMVLCIHGFPTNVSALQFEWAWQHPKESVAVREAATSFKTLGGLANKIKLALTMLTLPSWHSMDLTVSIFSTNYMKHTAGCPTLPRQMKLHFSSLDDLPCYSNPHYPCASDNDDDDDDDNDNDTDLHCSHHLNETPEFGFIETNPSTNTPSDTLQNTPEPDHVCEHQAIGRPLDEQDQCSADVRDSGDKLHCLANNVAPFGSYKFSDNIFPTLRKHVNSSSENNSDEYTRPRIEEPFQQPPHFMREQVSTIDYVLIDESPAEKHQPTGKNRLTSSTDIVSPTYTTEIEPIEIIDLYTPSPNYQNAAVSKKRRFSSSCSNFIDLTKSPVFLEQ